MKFESEESGAKRVHKNVKCVLTQLCDTAIHLDQNQRQETVKLVPTAVSTVNWV